MARNAETTWNMLNEAMSHFQSYIANKEAQGNRLALSMIDLLHVSNFKGGNASITEPVGSLSTKLKHYEVALQAINSKLAAPGKKLADLDAKSVKTLQDQCQQFMKLTRTEATHIRGFGESYASALLAAHFLDLCPVLDKWALRGARIPDLEVDKQDNIKNIGKHYPALIQAFYDALREAPGTSLRVQDKMWFIQRTNRAESKNDQEP